MTSKLVTRSDLKKAFRIKGLPGDILASCFMCVVGLNKINKTYSRISSYYGRDFTSALLNELNVTFEINEKELDNIPQEGPFIVTSNHPFGAIDGIILIHIFSSLRPDIRFMANFVLSYIPNIKEYIVPVNPFSDMPELHKSFGGLREAMQWLAAGKSLALFPAGEVSTNYGSSKVRDKEWQHSVMKLVKNAQVPVVPVYFHGSNSKCFHRLGRIHPLLRTLRLPRELLNKRDRKIALRIGRPIMPSETSTLKTLSDYGSYLRARTYAMEANLLKFEKECVTREMLPIALPRNRRALQKEINILDAKDHLFTTGNFSCYLVSADSVPLMLHELGRRREEAFRAIGEGTGKALDLDDYDTYYKHLILWDNHKSRLVGAYRLGFGSEIMESRGIRGFYSSTLFHYEKPYHDVLGHSIELGRSFVVREYQREALPLMLLIKGLFYTVVKYPAVKYLTGPVSISAWYPEFYRSLIVYYLRKKHSLSELERLAVPRHPFVPDFLRSDPEFLLLDKMESIEKFDRFLMRLSNNDVRMPTLVKKYLKINCRIIACNVDPDFNYCVDGLVLLDLADIPRSEIEVLSKGEPNRIKVLRRFGYEA
jgi:putative hemolysin